MGIRRSFYGEEEMRLIKNYERCGSVFCAIRVADLRDDIVGSLPLIGDGIRRHDGRGVSHFLALRRSQRYG